MSKLANISLISLLVKPTKRDSVGLYNQRPAAKRPVKGNERGGLVPIENNTERSNSRSSYLGKDLCVLI